MILENIDMKKTYVDVVVKHTKEGEAMPISIIWNNGKKYDVEKIKYICRASSTLVGGCGIRYTVIIDKKMVFLYDEENGKWFVEENRSHKKMVIK